MYVASLTGIASNRWGTKYSTTSFFVSLFAIAHTVVGCIALATIPWGYFWANSPTVGGVEHLRPYRGAPAWCLSHACHLRNAAERIKSCVPLAIIERPDDVPISRLCKS